MSDPVHIISLGAGVQSSTMALMAAAGEITPMPTAAIFADVGGLDKNAVAEPKSVYTWLDWLEKQLPFPVKRVTAGNLAADALRLRFSKKSGKHYTKIQIPLYIKDPSTGKVGMMMRKCTMDYKIVPLERAVRSALKPGESAIQWIGISTDEAMRMKDSRKPYIVHRWPLIEKQLSRHDCLRWMEKHGFPRPPKSACVFCPYHSDSAWRQLDSDSMAQAIKFEKDYQEMAKQDEVMRGVPFLHYSCKPLSEVDFSTEEERGQLDMFNNECEGMCGV